MCLYVKGYAFLLFCNHDTLLYCTSCCVTLYSHKKERVRQEEPWISGLEHPEICCYTCWVHKLILEQEMVGGFSRVLIIARNTHLVLLDWEKVHSRDPSQADTCLIFFAFFFFNHRHLETHTRSTTMGDSDQITFTEGDFFQEHFDSREYLNNYKTVDDSFAYFPFVLRKLNETFSSGK